MPMLREFQAARAALLTSLGSSVNEYSILSDISEYGISSSEVAEAEKQSIAELAVKPKRLAFVGRSSLKSLQSHRVAAQENMKSFSSEAAAMEWLASG